MSRNLDSVCLGSQLLLTSSVTLSALLSLLTSAFHRQKRKHKYHRLSLRMKLKSAY